MLCAALVGLAGVAVGQPLVPLQDEVGSPLLPTGISRAGASISGQLAYLFDDGDAHVMHVVGDFEMEIGDRSLAAKQAIVWMTPRDYRGRTYHTFEIFLYREAMVVEPAGTVTEAPLLFVTLSSFGEVFLSADRKAFGSSADTAVYQDAMALRDRVRAGLVDTGSVESRPPLTVTPKQVESPPDPPELHFDAASTTLKVLDDGRRVIVCDGGINLSRGGIGHDWLELRAETAVVFLRAADSAKGEASSSGSGGGDLESVYLEGDIRMTFGDRRVSAERLYYDLDQDRALILDAVARADMPGTNVSIVLRAEEIRQLGSGAFEATGAELTTSTYHTPHYHIGSNRIVVEDQSVSNLFEDSGRFSRSRYRIESPTFNVYNTPIFRWPSLTGRMGVSDRALRQLGTGYDGTFGFRLETDWDFFSLASLQAPDGFDARLSLDLLTDRGPAAGLDLDYERDTYFGYLDSYVVNDSGRDKLGKFRSNRNDFGTRGRARWRHRHYLPEDWELTVEASYISDRAFLEEYYKTEFEEDKDQESLIYLKKQRENWAFTALTQWRTNDFYTQVERLPELSFRVVGEPVGDWASWYSENRAGLTRYRAAEKEFFILITEGTDGPSSSTTARIDSRQELSVPIDVGPVRLAPFLVLRGSAWDETRSNDAWSNLIVAQPEGGASRLFLSYGVRGSMYFSKVYPNVRNEALDISGIRHVIKPEVVAWMSHSNRVSGELFLNDRSVEGIDDFDGVKIGVSQKLQTKRGGPDNRRVVDWMTLDIELGLFNDGRSRDFTNGYVSYTRPENSVSRNFLNTSYVWRMSDTTMFLSEMNYDLNDAEIDIFDVGFQVDRSPSLSYGVDYRFIEESNSNLLGFGMTYRIDPKHSLALRELVDLQNGRLLDSTVAYVRRYPGWNAAVIFEINEADDNVGVSFSLWPEGLPQAALGSRRFTGLAGTTVMKPGG